MGNAQHDTPFRTIISKAVRAATAFKAGMVASCIEVMSALHVGLRLWNGLLCGLAQAAVPKPFVGLPPSLAVLMNLGSAGMARFKAFDALSTLWVIHSNRPQHRLAAWHPSS